MKPYFLILKYLRRIGIKTAVVTWRKSAPRATGSSGAWGQVALAAALWVERLGIGRRNRNAYAWPGPGLDQVRCNMMKSPISANRPS
jgi:hypothetical protein